MALWQYTFYILPRESVNKYLPNFNFAKDEDGFDDSMFWKSEKVETNFFDEINRILPKSKSWSNNISLYGNQESNCLEILSENNIILSVTFRIDYTSHYENILNEVIEFCVLKGLLIIDEELHVIPLNFLAIRNVIENCSQYKKYKRLSNSSGLEDYK